MFGWTSNEKDETFVFLVGFGGVPGNDFGAWFGS